METSIHDGCSGAECRRQQSQDAVRWLELVEYNSGCAPSRAIIPEFDELTDRLAAAFPETLEGLSLTSLERASIRDAHAALDNAAKILEAKVVALAVKQRSTQGACTSSSSKLRATLAAPTRIVAGLVLACLGVLAGYEGIIRFTHSVAVRDTFDAVVFCLCAYKLTEWSCIMIKNAFLGRSLREWHVVRSIRMRNVRRV